MVNTVTKYSLAIMIAVSEFDQAGNNIKIMIINYKTHPEIKVPKDTVGLKNKHAIISPDSPIFQVYLVSGCSENMNYQSDRSLFPSQ